MEEELRQVQVGNLIRGLGSLVVLSWCSESVASFGSNYAKELYFIPAAIYNKGCIFLISAQKLVCISGLQTLMEY